VAARARRALRRSANSAVVAALDAQVLGFLQSDDAHPSQLQLAMPDAYQVHYPVLSVKRIPPSVASHLLDDGRR
jgi:hypothetical protein